MDRLLATKLLRDELNQWGLKDWGIRQTTDANGHFLGLCSYKDKCIILNAHHIDIHPDPEVINTIRHEIAHALTPGHAHDEIWAAKAREVGCDNTSPCSHLSLSPHIIDAIRSGATVEIEFDEEVIRKPRYTVTRLQDRCPDCGKVAVEKFAFEAIDQKTGDTIKMITLECFHIIKKIIPRPTAFEKLVTNSWKSEIKTCKHEFDKNKCNKCLEYKLFDFQVTSALFMEKAIATHKGVLVAHEMGLGKTMCALGYIYFHQHECCPVLYVVKSGIKFQWFKEIIRVLGPDHLPQVISTAKDFIFPGLKSYVISYDLLRTFPREKIEKLGIKLVVMDECQMIKNADSGRTQAIRKIVNNPEIKVIGLSGTPWKNKGSEFFPILNMLDPQKFHSYQNFLDRWVDFYWVGAKRKEGGINRPKEFKEYVKEILIRFERTEVMKELPLVSRLKLHMQLDELSQDQYDDATSDFVKWYNDAVMGGLEDKLSGLELLAKMTKMRHIAGLAKIPATQEFVDDFIENTERKLVVFVHHRDVGQILYDSFREKYSDMVVLRLTGEMSSEEKFAVQEQFNSAPRALMVASTLAAGEGLNLQTCADCVMHERQWNPANEEQAEGRFIRIGQVSSTVGATYVQGEGTIDEHFDIIVETKRRYFHDTMNNSEMAEWNQGDLAKQLAEMIVAKHKERMKAKNTKKFTVIRNA